MNMSTERPTDDEIEDTVNRYGTKLFQLCFAILCHRMDAEDAVTDTIIRYMTKAPAFRDEEHRKAWLYRTAANLCKDRRRFLKYREHVDLGEIEEICAAPEERENLESILRLPDKYKVVIYLFYVEGYRTEEIAEMLHISGAAVRKRLQQGRKLLRVVMEDGVE